ncbi:MAG: FAD-dependent oxidoreductase [bacterium]|nr:FAD-dependent oxidoreductase [bacterium]
MTHPVFPHLFAPMEIKGREIRNRVFVPGHNTALSEGGRIGDAMLAYHEARMKGGVGMVMTEVHCVHETYMPLGRAWATSDDCLPGLSRLARLGRDHGVRVIGQVFHPGRVAAASIDGTKMTAWAPSAVPDEMYKTVPAPLTRDLIRDIVKAHGDGAARMAEAGLDGIEIISSMGYLASQFLNPRLNRRDDEYGGSFANRMRFVREVAAAIRSQVGDDLIVGLRISADEMDEEGLTIAETREAAAALDADGVLDYLNVVLGSTATYTGWQHVIPHMHFQAGYPGEKSAALKEVVKRMPVLVAGRINQPQIAEDILARGGADMVGIVRGHIADPDFVKKAFENRVEDIRACIGCDQACIGHRLKGFAISCIQFPETGRELTFGTRQRVARPRRIVVAGGGPAGLKAAAVAAERGHEVVLLEAARQVGGQALLAQALPGRAEFGGIVTNLLRECVIHGVDVRRGVRATPETLIPLKPDVVICATGAVEKRPELEGMDQAHVVGAWAVAAGTANVGTRVVIYDWHANWIGPGVAEKLARDGCSVRLAVNGPMVGEHLPMMVRDGWMGELHKLGVDVITYARLYGCDEDSVFMQHVTSGQPIICDDVETLVLATPLRREAGLWEELTDTGMECHLVGDALAPRTAEEAVLEGLQAASGI